MEVEDAEGYLIVRCVGEVRHTENIDYAREAAQACCSSKHRTVLFDDREAVIETSPATEFAVFETFIAGLDGRHLRVASLAKPEYEEAYSFLETIARNRGHSYRVFYNEEQAVEWLLKDVPV